MQLRNKDELIAHFNELFPGEGQDVIEIDRNGQTVSMTAREFAAESMASSHDGGFGQVHRIEGAHPDYDSIASMLVGDAQLAVQRRMNRKVETQIPKTHVVERDGLRVSEQVFRYGRPQFEMEHEATLYDERDFVSDGELIVPVLGRGGWAAVKAFWHQFRTRELGWNRYPVWQMVPESFVSAANVDEASDICRVWAAQLKEQRAYDAEGWGCDPAEALALGARKAMYEVTLSEEVIEAIDYHQRFGHRTVSEA